MPSVWTIGPKIEPASLVNYARLLMDKGHEGMQDTVTGIIQGETRVLTAQMDLNDLFSDREKFKIEVVDKINDVIHPLGLQIYNANIAELADLDDKNRYFAEQKQRALQEVNQKARVAVAEAIKGGEIGEKMQIGETRKNVAGIELDVKIVRKAEGNASAVKIAAEANLFAKQKEADGLLYSEMRKAEAILATRKAEALGDTTGYDILGTLGIKKMEKKSNNEPDNNEL